MAGWGRSAGAIFLVTALVLPAPGDGGFSRQAGYALNLPRVVLWAWERPEDLRSHPDRSAAVAYLAGTVALHADGVEWTPRRQPLQVREGTAMIAVVRVEPDRAWNARLRASDVTAASSRIVTSAEAAHVRAVQIDFDATLSQRAFYRSLLAETRRQLPRGLPLTMTALASWCAEDWLDELPIDEAVPMLFQMGRGDAGFRSIGDSGRWRSRVCRGSVGLSTDEPQVPDRGRRVYLFNPSGWRQR